MTTFPRSLKSSLTRPLHFVTPFFVFVVIFAAHFTHAQTETIVYSFKVTGGDGVGPIGGVVSDTSGNLYGTTGAGGTANRGTVFEISSTGVETQLYQFTGGADGGQPYAGVVRDTAGNLYGTTLTGGTAFGTVYKVTPPSTEKVLVSFALTNGGVPFGGVIRDARGNLYGVTSGGGANFLGTAFKVSPAGTEKVLYSFKGAPDGAVPEGELVMDSKGNLYGVTSSGGTGTAAFCKGGCGTIFEISAAGAEKVLYSFTGGTDGAAPAGGSYLVIDSKGNLYGATTAGGTVTTACPNGCGVVFEFSPSAGEKVLHAFTGGSDGNFPYSGLLRDSKGNLYGTTIEGGTNNAGTLFQVTATGKEKVLHTFGATGDGVVPVGGLISDGAAGAYGTTEGGGAFGGGTVYHISPL